MRFGQLFCALLLSFAPVARAATERVTWNEFSAKVTPEHTIRMVLPDGTRIEGHPLQIKPDSLDLRVTRTSNKQAHPKGAATVPRKSVSVVQVRSPRWAGKLIGTLVPIAAGAAILGSAFNQGDLSYRLIPLGGVIVGAGAPSGYFIGRAVDNRMEEFIIAPEH